MRNLKHFQHYAVCPLGLHAIRLFVFMSYWSSWTYLVLSPPPKVTQRKAVLLFKIVTTKIHIF